MPRSQSSFCGRRFTFSERSTTRHLLCFGAWLALAAAAGAAAPRTAITLSGLETFTPTGLGERWGKESRWSADRGDYRIIVDAHDDGQLRLTVCRSWADLPTPDNGAVDERTLTVAGEVAYHGHHRFHLHSCPTMVWRRRAQPSIPTSMPAPIPNYDPAFAVSESDLERIGSGKYPWERFATVFAAPYDPWTEEHGRIIRGYSGGALALGGTEAAPLMPHQVVFLRTGDPRAWEAVETTAAASGNFAIHYHSRDTREAVRPAETGTLPFLQGESQVALRTAAGKTLPTPDVAHQHSLVYLAALLTGERYYHDELEAWAAYNLLTRPPGADRLKGVVWSGEIRATAWAFRALLEASLSDRGEYHAQLRANLVWAMEKIASPGAPGYRANGILTPPSRGYRASPTTVHFADSVDSRIGTWNHHVLAWVLSYAVDSGVVESQALLDHVLKVTRGVAQYSPTLYDWPWGNHADGADGAGLESWPAIMAATFAKRPAQPAAFVVPPTTQHYAAWMRSGLVAAVSAGQAWAPAALAELDAAMAAKWGGVPLDWSLVPSKSGSVIAPPPPAPAPPPPPAIPTDPGGPTLALQSQAVVLPWIARSQGALLQSSDLYVLNPGRSAMELSLEFRRHDDPEATPFRISRTLPPGATLYAADALKELFHLENAWGFLVAQVDRGDAQPVLTSHHTTFQSDGRRFGQTASGIVVDNAGAAPAGDSSSVQHLVGLSNDSERLSYFGVANPYERPATYRLRFYDRRGRKIGESAADQTLPGFASRQYQMKELSGLGVPAAADYRVEIDVKSGGSLVPYASILRLDSGDPAFVGAGSAAAATVYLLGAMSTPGRNRSLWRSDAVLSNVGGQALVTDITFTGIGSASRPTKPLRMALAAGQSVRLEEVVAAQWSLRNAVGVLTIRSNPATGVHPIVRGESYETIDPASRFGQSMAALTAADAAPAGRAQYLAGLREDSAHRTTLWLFNPGAAGAEYDVLYRALDGTVLGTVAAVRLAAGQVRQVSTAQHPLPAAGVAGGFTVQVAVKSGAVLSAAQVISTLSSDPAYIRGEVR